jgi:predicted short-subunit dehydrogenase-like oxidoreductase (DUF2520 family)
MGEALNIGFIGTGRVAHALAVGLSRAGVNEDLSVVALSNRNFSSAARLAAQIPGCVAYGDAQEVANASDLVFLTVSDDIIARIADDLRWRQGMAVVHCSGATTLSALQSAAAQGAAIGGFHPLQGFSDAQVALRTLPGCTAAIEAEEPLYAQLSRLAMALSMRPIKLTPDTRALYHLSGSYAASFMAALMHEAAGIWESFGFTRSEAQAALIPLAQGSLASVAKQGPVAALTGPISRGDAGTLQRHLEALRDRRPESLELYIKLAELSIQMAKQRGLSEEAVSQLEIVLKSFRSSP